MKKILFTLPCLLLLAFPIHAQDSIYDQNAKYALAKFYESKTPIQESGLEASNLKLSVVEQDRVTKADLEALEKKLLAKNSDCGCSATGECKCANCGCNCSKKIKETAVVSTSTTPVTSTIPVTATTPNMTYAYPTFNPPMSTAYVYNPWPAQYYGSCSNGSCGAPGPGASYMVMGEGGGGSCASGSCGVSTGRRGLFGRRR